jgi:carbamoyl-phosphate synthase large subunit
MVTVLITGLGSTTALSVVKGLRQYREFPIRIVGVDINPPAEIAGSAFVDAFYTVPRAVHADYLKTLLQICQKENVRALFPIIDIELEVIAAAITDFQRQSVHVWVSPSPTVRLCNDKYLTYQFFKEKGFPTAESWTPEELSGVRGRLQYPLVVKPRAGVSSIDVFVVEDEASLVSACAKAKAPIIQQYLTGPEFTIDVLSTQQSQVLTCVPRERIETKAGISYKGRTVRDVRLIEYAARIASALKMVGPCNIQCRIGDDGPRFFEINPRFSGTLPLTIAAGVNSPAILLRLALEPHWNPGPIAFRAGVLMTRYWEEVFRTEESPEPAADMNLALQTPQRLSGRQ